MAPCVRAQGSLDTALHLRTPGEGGQLAALALAVPVLSVVVPMARRSQSLLLLSLDRMSGRPSPWLPTPRSLPSCWMPGLM